MSLKMFIFCVQFSLCVGYSCSKSYDGNRGKEFVGHSNYF